MNRTMFKIMNETLKSINNKKKNNIICIGKFKPQENQLNEYYVISNDNSILVFKQVTKEIEGKYMFFKSFFKEERFYYNFLGTLSAEENPWLSNKTNLSYMYLDTDSLNKIEKELKKNTITDKIESFADMLCKYYNQIEAINWR